MPISFKASLSLVYLGRKDLLNAFLTCHMATVALSEVFPDISRCSREYSHRLLVVNCGHFL